MTSICINTLSSAEASLIVFKLSRGGVGAGKGHDRGKLHEHSLSCLPFLHLSTEGASVWDRDKNAQKSDQVLRKLRGYSEENVRVKEKQSTPPCYFVRTITLGSTFIYLPHHAERSSPCCSSLRGLFFFCNQAVTLFTK